MKIKLHHILSSLLFAGSALVNVSFAQDASSPEYQVTDSERERYERDKVIFSPGEGETRFVPPKNSSSTTSTHKDTVVVRQNVTPAAPVSKPKHDPSLRAPEKQQPQQSKTDDSVLSFNFLYYIIQKYKLQDLVD